MAAVLACGTGAVLSHTSAGELWGMLRSNSHSASAHSRSSAPHVTIPGEAKSRPGIWVHRSRTLTEDQVTRRLTIPVTTPTRTLADLRRTLPQPQFRAALRQAEYLGLPLKREIEPDHTRSELEARFLALCRRHRLPKPEVNVRLEDAVVDFLWRDRRLVVEVDGYAAHGGRAAFEADRGRDVRLRLHGYGVARFTWRQLVAGPRDVAIALGGLLRRNDGADEPARK
jgi:very-short-patch-repair endonuclease